MSKPATTLHLCNTHGQLLAALCDVVGTSDPATLIYLDDEVPLDADMQTRLRAQLPHLTLHVIADATVMDDFANLPAALPPLIRRNLRLWATPRGWCPDWLAGQRFARAYIHNSGFFTAKVVAGLSDSVTLRESGLNNYTGQPVHGLKRILRQLSGYPPAWQVMGEERWIDQIAVARPADLPAHVRPKGVGHDLQARLAGLEEAQKQTLLQVLSPDLPHLEGAGQTALLLTQPLDLVGMCDRATKEQLYAGMVTQLQAAGFTVFLKNHPRETPFTLADTTALDPITPIELWALTDNTRFDVGLALCSASLSHGTEALCARAIQLVSPDAFQRDQFNAWQGDIPARLAAALAP